MVFSNIIHHEEFHLLRHVSHYSSFIASFVTTMRWYEYFLIWDIGISAICYHKKHIGLDRTIEREKHLITLSLNLFESHMSSFVTFYCFFDVYMKYFHLQKCGLEYRIALTWCDTQMLKIAFHRIEMITEFSLALTWRM